MDITNKPRTISFLVDISGDQYISINFVDEETDEILYSADLHKDTIKGVIATLSEAWEVLDKQTILMN